MSLLSLFVIVHDEEDTIEIILVILRQCLLFTVNAAMISHKLVLHIVLM